MYHVGRAGLVGAGRPFSVIACNPKLNLGTRVRRSGDIDVNHPVAHFKIFTVAPPPSRKSALRPWYQPA